jgi:hypothetical protein
LSQSLNMIMSDEQIFTTNIYVSAYIGVIMYKLINDCLPFDVLSDGLVIIFSTHGSCLAAAKREVICFIT